MLRNHGRKNVFSLNQLSNFRAQGEISIEDRDAFDEIISLAERLQIDLNQASSI